MNKLQNYKLQALHFAFCLLLSAFCLLPAALNAQEMKMVTHLKNGSVIETPIATIDSITFSKQEEVQVILTISDATDITYTGATFNASVTTTATVTDKGICYAQNPEPTTADATLSKGAGTGDFSATLTGLEQNTDYYARPYAIANGNTYYGEVKEFKTLQEDIEEGVVINGVRWATRNLDTGGHFVAKIEDYGALFQWGRRADGHESRTSPSYPTNNYSEENGAVSELDANGQIPTTHAAYGKFVKQADEPWDWRTPQDDNLWGATKTANDPSPAGWRVPTMEELESLADETYVTREWTTKNGVNGYRCTDKATGASLFLPAAGIRSNYNGTLFGAGTFGFYWSSTPIGSNAYGLYFDSGSFNVSNNNRAHGFSVRCVADE